MRSLFYSDALEAAWMAKHFGVRFETSFELPAAPDKIYIHPDSYPIFDPQIEDLLLGSFSSGHLHYYLHVKEYYQGHGLQVNKAKLGDLDLRKIIQRQGKPFFWPEKE